MRHVRILGACLIALFMLGVSIASPALAESQKQLQKEFGTFAECPLGDVDLSACVWAQSSSGSEFQAGNVTVHLTRPITLQGGFEERFGEVTFVGAEYGYNTLAKVAEPGPDLDEIMEPSLLSASERETYEKDTEKPVTATIELAGPASSITLNEGNLLQESNETALGLPVQVKLSNPFLGKTCYVGSNLDPINISLVTGQSGELDGKTGRLEGKAGGLIIQISDDSIVNNTYAAPAASGCGKSPGAADAALNAKLGLPSPEGHNKAIIDGTLRQASAEVVKEYIG